MIITSTRLVLRPTQKLVLVPLGDLHHNAPGHDRERFLEVIEWIRKTGKRADRKVLVTGMGDYLDTLSASERRGLGAAGLHESTRERIEHMMLDDLKDLYDDLKPIARHFLCLVEGNHTYRFQEASFGPLVGKTTTQVLAEKLNVPYMGVCGVVVVELTSGDGPTASKMPFKVLLHHGFGNASTKGASIMQMLKLRERFPAMNLYVMGHNHVKIATTMEGIDVRRRKGGQWRMAPMVQAFVRSASFLRGYIEGEAVTGFSGSYVEEKCLVPAGLGVVTANLRWKMDSKGRACGFTVHTQE